MMAMSSDPIPGVKNIVADSFSRLLTLEGNSKIEGYEDLKASPAFVLAVLAVPEKGKLSPFKTPSKLYKLIASKLTELLDTLELISLMREQRKNLLFLEINSQT